MSSRHMEEGAGAEYADPRDSWCDRCGKTIYRGRLYPQTMSGTTEWLCSACVQRDRERYERMVGAA